VLPSPTTFRDLEAKGSGTLDWSIGRYEQIAEQLMPAVRVAVDHAAPQEDERVVDVGCGTGNAALLAAARGARVIGVDPAGRLLEVARGLAAEQGLEATFVEGDASAIPVADGEADLLLSVFGAFFAPDAGAAAAEMARVTAASGRIILTAWIPEGTISQLARASREALAHALARPPARTPFAWHDREALAGLFGPHGFEVTTHEEAMELTAASLAAYLEEESYEHPFWIAARAVLEPRGEVEALRARALGILEAGNEEPEAFRTTSRYAVATAHRA
jgi:ubiquinone/menaquinone biosynthesis C-methylase UbiE